MICRPPTYVRSIAYTAPPHQWKEGAHLHSLNTTHAANLLLPSLQHALDARQTEQLYDSVIIVSASVASIIEPTQHAMESDAVAPVAHTFINLNSRSKRNNR